MTIVQSDNTQRVHLHLTPKSGTLTEPITYTVNSGDAIVVESGDSPITGVIDNANPMFVSGTDGESSITAKSGDNVEEFTYIVSTVVTETGFNVTQDAPEPK